MAGSGNTDMQIRDNTVVFTHDYDAPRDLVFETWTDKDLIPSWWGSEGFTTVVEKMEVKPAGAWRFIQRDAAGKEYAFHGIYHDVSRPCRIVSTYEYEGMPGKVILDTITFDELPGSKTRLTSYSVFQSKDDLDGMLEENMEDGSKKSYERLGDLLSKFLL
jgi:uncharacterized protein YndB with AHSA1/START domain